jgi:hypothetical protein
MVFPRNVIANMKLFRVESVPLTGGITIKLRLYGCRISRFIDIINNYIIIKTWNVTLRCHGCVDVVLFFVTHCQLGYNRMMVRQ